MSANKSLSAVSTNVYNVSKIFTALATIHKVTKPIVGHLLKSPPKQSHLLIVAGALAVGLFIYLDNNEN